MPILHLMMVEDLRAEMAAVTQWQRSHEHDCDDKSRNIKWVIGLIVLVIMGIAGQLLIVTGKQDVVLNTLIQINDQFSDLRVGQREIQKALSDHMLNSK